MPALLPLMLVPLLVWAAVWGYLWSLDGKVKRLQDEMRRLEQPESE
jgi:CcmD family protein